MGVGRSTMSTTIARLVKSGYVARMVDSQDRRAVGLTLTPAGKRIQDQNTVLNPALVMQMLKLMEPEEADRALAGIERLAQVAAILLKRRKRIGTHEDCSHRRWRAGAACAVRRGHRGNVAQTPRGFALCGLQGRTGAAFRADRRQPGMAS